MATRQIFFQITPAQQAFFYFLALLSVAIAAYGLWARLCLWRQGEASDNAPGRKRSLQSALQDLFRNIIAHERIKRRTLPGRAHAMIFAGFLALFLGTCVVAIEHYGSFMLDERWLYKGWFYLAVKLSLDLLGLGLLAGLSVALYRRCCLRTPSLGHVPFDSGFLLLVWLATATGFLLEGAGIALDPARHPYAVFSPVGAVFSIPFRSSSASLYPAVWWIHMPFVLAVIALLPYGKRRHIFVAPLHIALQPERAMAELKAVSMEEVERTERIGLGDVRDFSPRELLSLDSCMSCGRCTDVCPAHAAGKSLNPQQVVLDLRSMMERSASNDGSSTDKVADEALWACTNCHACVRECPALIRHVDLIAGIRRFRVSEGRLAGSAATMLRQLGSRSNPWGMSDSQRIDWAQGLHVPLASDRDEREVLFWVGCAGAFEPRAQRTSRAVAELLDRAGVRFAVLGPKEKCTGDPARRTGDEFLFQQLAEANVVLLNDVGAKTIITACPHCLNTLKHEYPSFGGHYEVVHHTQYFAKLREEGRLPAAEKDDASVVYHDPCFLARANGETSAPRSVLRQVAELKEPGRRKCKAFCCGAGGGRMWMEEEPAQRPGLIRARELVSTGASSIAVGCPFCKAMLEDSVSQLALEQAPDVRDVAEVYLDALLKNSSSARES